MVEENFEIWSSESFQIDLILILSDNYYLTMVEEKFEIWSSETFQIDLILILSDKNNFTMVEENFEIEGLKRSRLIWFLYFLIIIISPWLKKLLKFRNLVRKFYTPLSETGNNSIPPPTKRYEKNSSAPQKSIKKYVMLIHKIGGNIK